MYYVEFLRVMRTVRIVGYILGAFLLLSLALRPFSHGGFNESNTIAGVDPSTVPARLNPDGSTTRTFTGRNGDRVTIVRSKDGHEKVTFDEAVSLRESHTANVTRTHGNRGLKVMRIDDYRLVHRHHRTTTTYDLRIPLFILIAIAAGAAAIVATLFGLALSRENDGHLELAWTKPVSRGRYALQVVATDALGILATGVATLITSVIVLAVYGAFRYITLDAQVLPTIAFSICFLMSFYAVVLAATASLRRGALALALLWPVAFILPTLVFVQWMNVGVMARALNTINPLVYFYLFLTSPKANVVFTLLPNGLVWQFIAPVALFAIGIALAVAQWRRLEA